MIHIGLKFLLKSKILKNELKLYVLTRLKIYSEQSVPPFGPSLPTPPIFTNHKEFREFLLVKCT
jgi:hypothetical protein